MLVLILLLFVSLNPSHGTEIRVRTRPGAYFSIPLLDFSHPRFSSDTPPWIKYEGKSIKGIASDEIKVHQFHVNDDDGSADVKVNIGIIPGSSIKRGECYTVKYFHKSLNLNEKIAFGLPGGYYTEDASGGTVFHYPTPCASKKRSGRASGHDDNKELDELGSGDDEDDDEDEDYEDEIEDPSIILQPTPILTFNPPISISSAIDEINTPFLTPSPSMDISLRRFLPSTELFQEFGSGDFEIEASTPLLVTPSASPMPEFEPSPTLPPEQPTLLKLIEKLQMPAGKVFKFYIGHGYFRSPHPISYFLEPATDSESVPDWLTLDDGFLVGWPSTDKVSDYKINLVAQDTVTNGRTSNEIFISVIQSRKSKNHNHEFVLEIIRNISHTPQIPFFVAIQRIQEFSGGRGEGDLVVTKISRNSQVTQLRWTNESLFFPDDQIKCCRCPEEELREIYLRLVTHSGSSSPSLGLIRALGPAYVPQQVEIHLIPKTLCAGIKPENITGQGTDKDKNKFYLPTKNFAPKIKHQVDSLSAKSGEYFISKVPENFCSDPEDGDTPFLTLILHDENGAMVEKGNWLQFDKYNQEFYGLPPPLDPPTKSITQQYTLVCYDKKNKTDHDALDVNISPAEAIEYSAEFRLHFQLQDDKVKVFHPPEIKKFMERLSQGLNQSIQNIRVVSYQTSGRDVHFFWNLRKNPSSEAQLTQFRRLMLEDDGKVKNSFRDLFRPDFNLTFGQIIPKGRLLGGGTQIHEVEIAEIETTEKEEIPILAEEGRTYLITYIIPATLIGIMILLALLFACLLSKKRKSLPRHSEESRAFIKKGVPVIFKDELEEDKGARSRSPAILRDEHPPLPPEYRRSPIQQYQPPPPMVKMGGPRGGVRPGTHYRKPPPYLPP